MEGEGSLGENDKVVTARVWATLWKERLAQVSSLWKMSGAEPRVEL